MTTPESFITVKETLAKAGFKSAHADVAMIAAISVSIADKETAETVIGLIDALEDLDDVQSVYSNVDIPEELLV
jgi:transcriptional/translational regulatory protein YebC/TACO1